MSNNPVEIQLDTQWVRFEHVLLPMRPTIFVGGTARNTESVDKWSIRLKIETVQTIIGFRVTYGQLCDCSRCGDVPLIDEQISNKQVENRNLNKLSREFHFVQGQTLGNDFGGTENCFIVQKIRLSSKQSAKTVDQKEWIGRLIGLSNIKHVCRFYHKPTTS